MAIGPEASIDSESPSPKSSDSPTHKTKSQPSELDISEMSKSEDRQEVFDNYLQNWGK